MADRCQWHSWESGPLDLTMMEQCARTDILPYGFGDEQIWWLCPEHAPMEGT